MDENKEIQDILDSEERVDAFCDALEKLISDEVSQLVDQLQNSKTVEEANQILAAISTLPRSPKIQNKITEVVSLYTAELESIKAKFPVNEQDANTAISMAQTHIDLVTSILQESVSTIVSQLTLANSTENAPTE